MTTKIQPSTVDGDENKQVLKNTWMGSSGEKSSSENEIDSLITKIKNAIKEERFGIDSRNEPPYDENKSTAKHLLQSKFNNHPDQKSPQPRLVLEALFYDYPEKFIKLIDNVVASENESQINSFFDAIHQAMELTNLTEDMLFRLEKDNKNKALKLIAEMAQHGETIEKKSPSKDNHDKTSKNENLDLKSNENTKDTIHKGAAITKLANELLEKLQPSYNSEVVTPPKADLKKIASKAKLHTLSYKLDLLSVLHQNDDVLAFHRDGNLKKILQNLFAILIFPPNLIVFLIYAAFTKQSFFQPKTTSEEFRDKAQQTLGLSK